MFRKSFAKSILICLLLCFPLMAFVFLFALGGDDNRYAWLQCAAYVAAVLFSVAALKNSTFHIGTFLSVVVFSIAFYLEIRANNPDLSGDPEYITLCEDVSRSLSCETKEGIRSCLDPSGADKTSIVVWCEESGILK